MKYQRTHIIHAQHRGATESLCGCTNIPPHRQVEPQHVKEALELADSPRYPNVIVCGACHAAATDDRPDLTYNDRWIPA